MHVLFEDEDIIIINKPFGVPTTDTAISQRLNEKVYIVHRLDTQTTGVLVLAKNQKSASELSKAIANRNFKKEYLAVVSGECPESDTLEDELFFDKVKNKSFVVKKARKGTKHASLSFEKLKTKDDLSLVKILLHTGRTHQIRVQFASRKMSLFGDGKYGSVKNGKIALHCYSVEFEHPTKHTIVHITCPPPTNQTAWNIFGDFDELAL